MGLFIGVMSGTSMDAVDTVLVDLSTSSPQLVASLRSPWDSALRNRMRSYAAGQPLDAAAYAGLDADVGEFFAAAIQALLSQTRPRSSKFKPSAVTDRRWRTRRTGLRL